MWFLQGTGLLNMGTFMFHDEEIQGNMEAVETHAMFIAIVGAFCLLDNLA